MRIGITSPQGDSFVSLEVLPDEEILNVKALLSTEIRAPVEEIVLLFNGRELQDTDRLLALGIKEDDILIVQRRPKKISDDLKGMISNISNGLRQALQNPQNQQAQAPPRPAGGIRNEAAAFRQQVLNTPGFLERLRTNDPEVAQAVLSNDDQRLSYLLQDRMRRANMAQRGAHSDLMDLDPLSVEYQRRLEEHIRQENIQENLQYAMEHLPESFGNIVMLYINALVNNEPVKVFVDSGAQQTIMSESCARRCNLMRLIDTRFAGIAQGVGTAKILGRVHLAPIKIGNSFFPCTFTILEDQGIEFLLGLDFLRRYQCQIDLKANVLRIGDEAVEFLPEKDIPKNERENKLTEKQIAEIERRELEEAARKSQEEKPTGTGVANPPASQYTEDVIQPLMGLGYPRDAVIRALEAANGNPDLAASILLGS